jgi:hypothetical protein
LDGKYYIKNKFEYTNTLFQECFLWRSP